MLNATCIIDSMDLHGHGVHEIPQSRPMNVERIVEEAQNFEFNPLIPLKYWLRTATTLLKEVRIRQISIKLY